MFTKASIKPLTFSESVSIVIVVYSVILSPGKKRMCNILAF